MLDSKTLHIFIYSLHNLDARSIFLPTIDHLTCTCFWKVYQFWDDTKCWFHKATLPSHIASLKNVLLICVLSFNLYLALIEDASKPIHHWVQTKRAQPSWGSLLSMDRCICTHKYAPSSDLWIVYHVINGGDDGSWQRRWFGSQCVVHLTRSLHEWFLCSSID